MKLHILVVALTIITLPLCASAENHARARRGRPATTTLPLPITEKKNSYDLKNACDGKNYYHFMEKKLTPKLQELAGNPTHMKNDDALAAGNGAGVKLDSNNYNFHINFPDGDKGGRSYGWSHGNVGDWSDKTYLDNLEEVSGSSDDELETFYSSIIHMLGNCDTSELSTLDKHSQQVSNNFLAIYTAEQYRAMLGNTRWDDALLQVTLLAAFHGGQTKLSKYYAGEFSDKAVDQSGCVYHIAKKGAAKRDAQLNDYWQFGRSVHLDENGNCKGTSGINPTRKDFEAMGESITEYERDVAGNKTLAKIEKIVGKSDNVIKAISEYFTKNQAKVAQTDDLAANVAKFMVEINHDANKITKWLND